MNGRSLLAFLRRDQWPSGSKPLDGESPPDRISVRARGLTYLKSFIGSSAARREIPF